MLKFHSQDVISTYADPPEALKNSIYIATTTKESNFAICHFAANSLQQFTTNFIMLMYAHANYVALQSMNGCIVLDAFLKEQVFASKDDVFVGFCGEFAFATRRDQKLYIFEYQHRYTAGAKPWNKLICTLPSSNALYSVDCCKEFVIVLESGGIGKSRLLVYSQTGQQLYSAIHQAAYKVHCAGNTFLYSSASGTQLHNVYYPDKVINLSLFDRTQRWFGQNDFYLRVSDTAIYKVLLDGTIQWLIDFNLVRRTNLRISSQYLLLKTTKKKYRRWLIFCTQTEKVVHEMAEPNRLLIDQNQVREVFAWKRIVGTLFDRDSKHWCADVKFVN